MARRRARAQAFDGWPGYVDALATLLMVIIFVLLVFILGQGFLSAALSNRDRALDELNRQVAELGEALGLERASLAGTTAQLQAALAARDAATQQLGATAAERDRIALRLPELQATAETLSRRLVLEEGARAAAERGARETTGALETARLEMATLRRQIAEGIARAAELDRVVAALRAEAEAANRTVRADRATIEARLADLARLRQEIARLEGQRGTAPGDTMSEPARAQVALLTRQIQELRSQLSRLAGALDTPEGQPGDAQLANLRARLTAELANRVEELQGYRSEFFGRLRAVLGDRPEVRIVGDRFIFQSEVLFPPASADLSPAGQAQIRQLSRVLLDIARRIPNDVPWLLRVDGHADRNPIRSQRFASNWELSAARAIAVANLLMEAGLPANRVAAAAFGEHQPIDPADTPDALARNRRIELRLTDR